MQVCCFFRTVHSHMQPNEKVTCFFSFVQLLHCDKNLILGIAGNFVKILTIFVYYKQLTLLVVSSTIIKAHESRSLWSNPCYIVLNLPGSTKMSQRHEHGCRLSFHIFQARHTYAGLSECHWIGKGEQLQVCSHKEWSNFGLSLVFVRYLAVMSVSSFIYSRWQENPCLCLPLW